MTNSEYCTNVDKMVLEDGSPDLIRRQIMYRIFDLARASALLRFPKESGVYKLGIERSTTAIDFLKNILDRYPETLSPNELDRIEQLVLIHKIKDKHCDITSA